MEELDGKLEILEAVDENSFIRITDSLLKRMHGQVLSVDRGKRQVRIRISLMGQPKIVTMNYQLLGEEEEPEKPGAGEPPERKEEKGQEVPEGTPEEGEEQP